MKKKRIVSFVLVSIAFIAAAIITSCSSEFEEECFGSYSPQEKTEIESLAKEYGLNVAIVDNYFGKKYNKKVIAKQMEKMCGLLGEYEIIGEEKNEIIRFATIKKEDLRSVPIDNPNKETIWSGTETYSFFSISVYLYRTLSSGNYSIGTEIESNEYVGGSTIVDDSYCLHTGYLITFSADLVYLAPNGLEFLFYVRGTYDENNKDGSFTVSVFPS